MEQFVLGIFQEQLAKYIIGFKKEQVNANLLNGKGEITDIELNCAVLNETITKMTPYVELERVHCSRVSFQVTSWTNLRKAPIIVDVHDVTATLLEPLHWHDRSTRKQIRQILTSQLIELIRAGIHGTRSPYNLFDRILDNLCLEVRHVSLIYRTMGKFKTRRVGPWTPPGWHLSIASIRLVSVNEYGSEASPEECWRHNHQYQHNNGKLMIFKKLSMEYQLSLVPTDGPKTPLFVGMDNALEIQIAIQRRIRDAAVLALQVDCVLPTVEVNIPQSVLSQLAHALVGLHYCFAKDRGFLDPLKPLILSSSLSMLNDREEAVNLSTVQDSTEFKPSTDDEDDDVVLPHEQEVIADGEDEERSFSSSDESHASVDLNSVCELDEGTALALLKSTKILNLFPSEEPSITAAMATSQNSATDTNAPKTSTAASRRLHIPIDRPIILLPNGVVIYNKISFSVAIHSAAIRGTYMDESGHIQVIGKGVIFEVIWPKCNQKKGGYVQSSVAFVSIQERFGSRIRTLLAGGVQYNDGPLELSVPKRKEVPRDESFPMYEDRGIRPDPTDTGIRYTYPEQAFGLKMTIDYVKKLLVDESLPVEERECISVQHEVGMKHFDIIFDSISWCRGIRFAANELAGGYDPRWYSGDWSNLWTTDMLVDHITSTLNLDKCIQPSKQLFLDENQFFSSDLFNVTARVTKLEIRIPAAINDDVRSCDIVLVLEETMLVVSSALPRTFISGKLGNSVNGDNVETKGLIDFPNDPSDLAYVLERSEDPANRQKGIATSRPISTFRLQLTLRGVAIRLNPLISIGVAPVAQELVARTELTMVLCFEGEPPANDTNLTKIVIFFSVLAHKLDLNIDLELATSAIGTISCHAKEYASTCAACLRILQANCPPKAMTNERFTLTSNEEKIVKSFSGRRVLVRRQIRRSRETGGVSISFCFKAAGVNFSLWRQNVPYGSPLHTIVDSSDLKIKEECSNKCINLVQLLRLDFSEIEIGLEASFLRSNRRIVFKFCLSSLKVSACDVNRLRQNREGDHGLNGKADGDIFCMVDVARLGRDCIGTLAVRLEESLDPIRTWILSADLNSSLELLCDAKTFEGLAFMIFEVLLLPAWSKPDAIPDYTSREHTWAFPSGSVGALLVSIALLSIPRVNEVSSVNFPLVGEASSETNSDVVGNELFRRFCTIIIPKDVLVILARFTGRNIKLELPFPCIKSSGYEFLIENTECIASFFAFDKAWNVRALNKLCQTRTNWSKFVPHNELGLRFCLWSNQKLLRWSVDISDERVAGTLIDSFECIYSFEKSKAVLSLGKDVVFNKMTKLDTFLGCLQVFVKSYDGLVSNLSNVLSTVRVEKHLEKGSDSTLKCDNPVGVACLSVNKSLRMVRESLLIAHSELARNQNILQSLIQAQNLEIMKMQTILFNKERERLNTLALVSSQMAGWLRIGSSHRLGQRGMMSWNLLPKWSILRSSLLILCTNTTDVSSSNVVNLKGASLKSLSGRRKRDLKRAFAIIEKSGDIHLVLVSTEREYISWVHELQKVSNSPGTEYSDDLSQSQHSASRNHFVTEDATSVLQSDAGGTRQSVGRSISRAVQVARVTGRAVKATGQAVVDRNRLRRECVNDSQHGSATSNFSDLSVTLSNCRMDDSENAISPEVSEKNECSFQNRRLTICNKISGVGTSTKNRFGSAIHAARQKSRDVSQTTPVRMTSNGVTSSSNDRKFDVIATPTLDRLNDSSFSKNDLSLSVDSVGPALNEDLETKNTFLDESICFDSESYRKVETSLHEHGATGSRGLSKRFGTAVKCVNSKLSLSKVERQSSITNSTTYNCTVAPDAVRMHNVGISGELPRPSHPIYGTEYVDNLIPCRRLNGWWRVRVKSVLPSDFSVGAESNSETDVGCIKRLSEHLRTDLDTNDTIQDQLDTDVLLEKSFICNDSVVCGDNDKSTDDLSHFHYEDLTYKAIFQVQVLHASDASNFRQVADISTSFSNVLVLHTTISESMVSMSSLSYEEDAQCGSTKPMQASLASSLGLTTVDTMRLSGQFLAGLFGVTSSQSSVDYLNVCCNAIREFLNSMLDCSLPIDGLVALVEFLNIMEFSTVLPRPDFSRTESNAEAFNGSKIFALSETAMQQLTRAENQSFLAARLAWTHAQANVDCASSNRQIIYQPVSVSHQFRESMYAALMNVMEERDEAHARMVAAGVLHVHEIDQQQKSVRRLCLELELLKSRQTPDSDNKNEQLHCASRAIQQDSEAELLSLCQQLAIEISSRTSASLEIVRLKESRKLEREHESYERLALENELKRTKEQVFLERRKLERSQKESEDWKKAYEEVLERNSEPASLSN